MLEVHHLAYERGFALDAVGRPEERPLKPGVGLGVEGLGCGIWGLEFGIWGLGLGVECLGIRVES